jgi:hypothetical protein
MGPEVMVLLAFALCEKPWLGEVKAVCCVDTDSSTLVVLELVVGLMVPPLVFRTTLEIAGTLDVGSYENSTPVLPLLAAREDEGDSDEPMPRPDAM